MTGGPSARLHTLRHRAAPDQPPPGMIHLEARLDELDALGLHSRMPMVSGPQGPHVVLDGKPVLSLCSDNYLGLADHPQVRKAAAEAAMRWGVGAGSGRLESGTMTLHRRLEKRLAQFVGRETALLFGSGYLANLGAIDALARPGDIVFCDELSHASIADGCRLSGAEVFVYEHCDTEHLAWGIREAGPRGALIATESVFAIDGDLAPLPEIAQLAERHRLEVLTMPPGAADLLSHHRGPSLVSDRVAAESEHDRDNAAAEEHEAERHACLRPRGRKGGKSSSAHWTAIEPISR